MNAKAILEAAIFISEEPVSLESLRRLFTAEEQEMLPDLSKLLEELKIQYASNGAIELTQVATGYRFQVNSNLAQKLTQWKAEQPPRYSKALLETLALIAYKQPITRAEIEEIRGVSVSSHIIRTLQDREWIEAIGYREVPGKPVLYSTTSQLLNDLNLQNLSQLSALLAKQTHEETKES